MPTWSKSFVKVPVMVWPGSGRFFRGNWSLSKMKFILTLRGYLLHCTILTATDNNVASLSTALITTCQEKSFSIVREIFGDTRFWFSTTRLKKFRIGHVRCITFAVSSSLFSNQSVNTKSCGYCVVLSG